jgi:hypothetical protein
MTSFTIEVLPDEPIVLVTLYADFIIETDQEQTVVAVRAVLDSLDEPYFYLNDIQALAPVELDDVLVAAALVTQGDYTIYHHPNIHESILISPNRLVKFTAQGMNTEPFGFVTIRIFDTLDEALAYARSS